MSQKSIQIMLAENQEAKKILAELGALLGAAAQPETSAKNPVFARLFELDHLG
jgi:hypothetical protein